MTTFKSTRSFDRFSGLGLRSYYRTLFITCSDCEVSLPVGNRFIREHTLVVRTAGNCIVPYVEARMHRGMTLEDIAGFCQLEEIIVCGQSQCRTLEPFETEGDAGGAAQLNVVKQIGNVGTYPRIALALEEKLLRVRGWIFRENKHDWLEYDEINERFLPFDSRDEVDPFGWMWNASGASHYRG